MSDFRIKNGVLVKYVGNGGDVVIPDSVTAIGVKAFKGCSSLMSITISDSVTSIGDEAFLDCSRLTSITIPDSVTSIGEEAFSGCSRLTSISVPDSVTSIEAPAFTECENLQDFTCPSSFAKQLQTILPKTKTTIILYMPDISGMSTKFLLSAVIGFVEDKRDWSDENGKAYAKYIKTKALKLAGMAIEHPDLFYLMLREKLISAKDLDAFTKTVQDSGKTELIAAILDYANSSVSEKDKAKVQQKKETFDMNVTNFLFDATKMEKNQRHNVRCHRQAQDVRQPRRAESLLGSVRCDADGESFMVCVFLQHGACELPHHEHAGFGHGEESGGRIAGNFAHHRGAIQRNGWKKSVKNALRRLLTTAEGISISSFRPLKSANLIF